MNSFCIIVSIFSIPCKAQNFGCLINQSRNILGMKFSLHSPAVSATGYCWLCTFMEILMSGHQNAPAQRQAEGIPSLRNPGAPSAVGTRAVPPAHSTSALTQPCHRQDALLCCSSRTHMHTWSSGFENMEVQAIFIAFLWETNSNSKKHLKYWTISPQKLTFC